MSNEALWVAKDEDGGEIQLDAIGRTGEWQLSVTEGNFEGYPSVDISREDLERLGKVIREALSIPNESDS